MRLAKALLILLALGSVDCTTAFDPALLPHDAAVDSPTSPIGDAGDAAPIPRDIACGESTCPLSGDTVCCFDPETATHECVARASCTKTAFGCDDTKDCVSLGKPTFTCCATTVMVSVGVYVARESRCVAPGGCDATGLQDQLCDTGDPSECTQAKDTRTACKHYPWTGAMTYGYCTSP